jgi:uncharacterized membrane protein HdeD (DUF308 family)
VANAEREDPPHQSGAQLFWHHKPWWCQPWSILLTGALGIALDLLAFFRLSVPLWLVLPFLLCILAWWFLFLVLVPSSAQADNNIY